MVANNLLNNIFFQHAKYACRIFCSFRKHLDMLFLLVFWQRKSYVQVFAKTTKESACILSTLVENTVQQVISYHLFWKTGYKKRNLRKTYIFVWVWSRAITRLVHNKWYFLIFRRSYTLESTKLNHNEVSLVQVRHV